MTIPANTSPLKPKKYIFNLFNRFMHPESTNKENLNWTIQVNSITFGYGSSGYILYRSFEYLYYLD